MKSLLMSKRISYSIFDVAKITSILPANNNFCFNISKISFKREKLSIL